MSDQTVTDLTRLMQAFNAIGVKYDQIGHGAYDEEWGLFAADGQNWAFYFDSHTGQYLRSRSA